MSIYLAGLNHETAPLEVRERLAVGRHSLKEVLRELGSYIPCGILLSTCNRMELYAAGNNSEMKDKCRNFLTEAFKVSQKELHQHFYFYEDRPAVEHLFSVTSGLDSMLIGECEVMGQVRAAFEAAKHAEMTDLCLRKLFDSALITGRRVRQETAISQNALSVSSAAVGLAEREVSLSTARMVVIGSGEAGQLVAKVAREKKIKELAFISRHLERANVLASELGVQAFDYERMDEEVIKADIAVTSADTRLNILDREHIERLVRQRHGRPLLIIDIGMPRNVKPDACLVEGVHLYNIDDLHTICRQNRLKREDEVQAARAIIHREVGEFLKWHEELKVRPIIRSLASRAEAIRSHHLETTLKGLSAKLSSEERENIEDMTKAIVNKILREPIDCLKDNPDDPVYANAAAILFKLEDSQD